MWALQSTLDRLPRDENDEVVVPSLDEVVHNDWMKTKRYVRTGEGWFACFDTRFVPVSDCRLVKEGE